MHPSVGTQPDLDIDVRACDRMTGRRLSALLKCDAPFNEALCLDGLFVLCERRGSAEECEVSGQLWRSVRRPPKLVQEEDRSKRADTRKDRQRGMHRHAQRAVVFADRSVRATRQSSDVRRFVRQELAMSMRCLNTTEEAEKDYPNAHQQAHPGRECIFGRAALQGSQQGILSDTLAGCVVNIDDSIAWVDSSANRNPATWIPFSAGNHIAGYLSIVALYRLGLATQIQTFGSQAVSF